MYQTLLWEWQSLFILTNLECHINFSYTCVTETWLSILYGAFEVYCLACVKIIEIIQGLLNYNHFNNTYWINYIYIYIYIIRHMLLYFGYHCVPWTWMIQAWYWYIFDDVNLMNRLLLSRPLVYFILQYICNTILINIYPDDWRFAIGWKFDIFPYHALVIIRLK